MKNKKRYPLFILLLFAVSFILYSCGQSPDPENVDVPADTLDFSTLPEGTHRGTFTYGSFNFIVDVVVQDAAVTEIILIQNRDNDPSREAEVVLDRIVEAQSLNVDGVTGATVSSRSLMKAVESALKNALQ